MATGNIARGVYRLYVQNLPWTIGHTELKHYFAQFGRVDKATVIFDSETGMSKRYGFITTPEKDTYEKILGHPHHKLEGLSLTIRQKQE